MLFLLHLAQCHVSQHHAKHLILECMSQCSETYLGRVDRHNTGIYHCDPVVTVIQDPYNRSDDTFVSTVNFAVFMECN